MPRRSESLLINQIYHIYNRGVNKELIFFSERNYHFFIERMKKYLTPNSNILAYCLMPNHFHLLVLVKTDGFQKSLYQFLMSYAMAINSEQGRVGPLFQGRYKARIIDDEGYLLDCAKYIHLNPVMADLVNSPESWKFSSYNQYINKGNEFFLTTNIIMGFFDEIPDFCKYHEIEFDHAKMFDEV